MAARRKQITFSKPKPLTVRGVVSAFLGLPEGWGGHAATAAGVTRRPRRFRRACALVGQGKGTSETLPRDVALPPEGPGGHLRLLPVAGRDDAQEGEDQVDAGRRAGR